MAPLATCGQGNWPKKIWASTSRMSGPGGACRMGAGRSRRRARAGTHGWRTKWSSTSTNGSHSVTASDRPTTKRMTHPLGRQPRRMGIQRWGKPEGSAEARSIHLWGHIPPGIMAMRHHFDKAVNCCLRPVCEQCRASMLVLGPVILALWRFARCCGWLGLSQGHLRHASSACGGLTSSPWAPPTLVLTKLSTVATAIYLVLQRSPSSGVRIARTFPPMESSSHFAIVVA
jgi:hypothetical protein